MNYTLHQLKVFAAVAEYQSITKAAEALHLTQPAVSIQLKNFQNQFKIPLTEVVSRQLYLTDFGQEIAEACENILNEVDEINSKVLSFQGQISGKLKVSVVSTGKYIMPYFLNDFLKLHPGIELQMDVTNKAEVVESLVNNEVDFSLISVMPDQLQLNSVPLMENKLMLVGSRHHELKANQVYRPKILERIELISREKGSGTRETTGVFLAKEKLQVRRKLELKSNEAVKQAVIAGLGYSIMPLIGIKNELSLGDLDIIPVKRLPIKSMWQLVWVKNKKHGPAAKEFAQHIAMHKDKIIHEHFSWYEQYD